MAPIGLKKRSRIVRFVFEMLLLLPSETHRRTDFVNGPTATVMYLPVSMNEWQNVGTMVVAMATPLKPEENRCMVRLQLTVYPAEGHRTAKECVYNQSAEAIGALSESLLIGNGTPCRSCGPGQGWCFSDADRANESNRGVPFPVGENSFRDNDARQLLGTKGKYCKLHPARRVLFRSIVARRQRHQQLNGSADWVAVPGNPGSHRAEVCSDLTGLLHLIYAQLRPNDPGQNGVTCFDNFGTVRLQRGSARRQRWISNWKQPLPLSAGHRQPTELSVPFQRNRRGALLRSENLDEVENSSQTPAQGDLWQRNTTNETSSSAMSEEYRNQTCDETTSARIVGGRDARFGDAPFVVSLRHLPHERHYGFGSGLFCAGSLINTRLVLTAAHCLAARKPADVGVVAGVLNRYDRSAQRMQFRQVYSVLLHPDWNPQTFRADIGLVAVRSPFVFVVAAVVKNIHAIGLPSSEPQEGQRCTIYGWGRTEDANKRSGAVCLQKADVTVLDLDRCNRSVSPLITVPDGALCAGSFDGLVDSCQGDSGGPLVCNMVVTGIVSFGWHCGRRHFPGVYTDVFRYRQWVEKSTDTDPKTWFAAATRLEAYSWLATGAALIICFAHSGTFRANHL